MWSKFDDQFFLNPKNAAIDRDEQDLNIAGIIYCNGQLTDGFIPIGALPMLCAWAKIDVNLAGAKAIANHLVEHSYWEIAENGYQIHDFLDWNYSREQVEEHRKERSEAGRRGGLAKAKAIAKREPKQMPSKIVPSTSTSTLLTTTTRGDEQQNIFSLYSNEISALTPMMRDELIDAEKNYSADWISAAIGEAVRNNKRNWKYIRAILERWKAEGFQSPRNPTPSNGIGRKPKTVIKLDQHGNPKEFPA